MAYEEEVRGFYTCDNCHEVIESKAPATFEGRHYCSDCIEKLNAWFKVRKREGLL